MKRVKASALARGDIILTTSTATVSKAIRLGTKSDISHAMVYVQHCSVIDATSEGVHARNTQRLFFEDECALHVLRLKAGLTPEQAEQVCQFVRQRVGSEYSTREAIKTVIGGAEQWTRKQFCSRLVAQAYASAGIKLVADPNYCAPADLARSSLLVAVPDAMEPATSEDAARWASHPDSTEAMRSAINAVLDGARKKDKNIQTFEDIIPYLVKHPKEDAYFADILASSGYLTVWQINTEKNPGNMTMSCWHNCHLMNAKVTAAALCKTKKPGRTAITSIAAQCEACRTNSNLRLLSSFSISMTCSRQSTANG